MSFSIMPKAEHQPYASLLLPLVCAHVCASVQKDLLSTIIKTSVIS